MITYDTLVLVSNEFDFPQQYGQFIISQGRPVSESHYRCLVELKVSHNSQTKVRHRAKETCSDACWKRLHNV